MKRFIKIKTSFEGYHKYPNAPKEVKFLKNDHRHIFNVIVTIEVFNDDREIEFILFKRFINKIIHSYKNMNNKSCEMISDIIFKKVSNKYKKRKIIIEVNEDNENGSITEYEIGEKLDNKLDKKTQKHRKNKKDRDKRIPKIKKSNRK